MTKLLDGPEQIITSSSQWSQPGNWMILLLVGLLACILLGGSQHFSMPNFSGQGGGYIQSHHHSHHND
jgi:hypothetical protein